MVVDPDHPFAHLYNNKILPDRASVLRRRKRGRPKGSPNERAVLEKLLSRKHTAGETGETRTILEWIVLTLKKKVVEGDFAAIEVYEEFFGALLNSEETNRSRFVMLVPQVMSQEEWIEAVEKERALVDSIRDEIAEEMGRQDIQQHYS